jgi:hypothetical protein
MNKRAFRSFALGILFAVALISFFYYFNLRSQEKDINLEHTKKILEEEGYIVLLESEFNSLQEETKDREEASPAKNNEIQASNDDPQTDQSESDLLQSPIINYELEVARGTTSDEIAKVLAEQKIVKDEQAFAQFLINHGYQTKIQLGLYPLTNKMSYEQIATMITN